MNTRAHWERMYGAKAPDRHSWHQDHLRQSLELIAEARLPNDAWIIDVGGGDSTLVDDLLGRAYRNITVLDISGAALERAKARLGERGAGVHWLEADIEEAPLTANEFDLWHDRALFHFLTDSVMRLGYLDLLRKSVRRGGYVVMATFAEDGPEHCSGLPTTRYSQEALGEQLGAGFELMDSRKETHQKPQGGEQQFVYCLFRKA